MSTNFSKMYLVSENEYAWLQRQQNRPRGTRRKAPPPTDETVVTNSLKAVTKQRKKEAISSSVPKTKRHKYVGEGGIPSMTDAQVTKPLRRAACQQQPAPPPPITPPPSPISQRLRSQSQEEFTTPKMSLRYYDVGGQHTPQEMRAYDV